jgi:hypothetical protein
MQTIIELFEESVKKYGDNPLMLEKSTRHMKVQQLQGYPPGSD